MGERYEQNCQNYKNFRKKIMKLEIEIANRRKKEGNNNSISIGDRVLVKQDHHNKFSTKFNPKIFKVIHKFGNSVIVETVEKPYVRYKRNVTHIKKYYESDRNREIKSETSNKNVFDDISYKVPNQNDHSAIFGNDHTIVPNQNINPDSVSNQSNIDHDDSSDESIKTFNSYQRPKRNRKRPLRYRND
ncbi:hypothetical protein LOTGIDRAFT_176726 [Lottia gigantea]|uniref:Uncharacterized protein n=1 Tax=Lottia gigantea TaxID=225164 RepID=V4AC24_LOTGI|nr:hypothetical protein LOTGIDRAFT_176726 [Lottia gigantea]ESO94362.1 hypothetical protein LOTGIDRAFT_176726 [Lottia gigantea]